jgi:hypothetical protein
LFPVGPVMIASPRRAKRIVGIAAAQIVIRIQAGGHARE